MDTRQVRWLSTAAIAAASVCLASISPMALQDPAARRGAEPPPGRQGGVGRALAVMVLQNEQGLDDWTRAVADQLALEGFIAVAPDLLRVPA
jgi:hypothetical protein